jgi:hypothetical protein
VSLSMKVRNKAMDEVASDATSTMNKKSDLKRKRSEEQVGYFCDGTWLNF